MDNYREIEDRCKKTFSSQHFQKSITEKYQNIINYLCEKIFQLSTEEAEAVGTLGKFGAYLMK